MEKSILAEMGRRYPRTAPVVRMQWADGSHGINCLTHLNNLIDDHEIIIKLIDPRQVHAPVISGNWRLNENREVMARFPLGFALRDDFSLNVLSSGGLEGMYLIDSNPLNKLMIEDQEEREEVADIIIRNCLDEKMRDRFSTWKIMVKEACLCASVRELPGIRFVFEYRMGKILEVLLDAWSGSIIINRADQGVPFVSGKQFREVIGLT